jgi:hypothetical protein
MLDIQTGQPGQVNNISTDTSAGFNIAELECRWDNAQPSAPSAAYNTTVINDYVAAAQTLKSDGYQIAVSAGIFNYPSWLASYAGTNWQYKDQSGAGSGSVSGEATPNWAFNPQIRSLAGNYISTLTAAMAAGGVTVDYYRIGLSASGEFHYPANGSWWAFDALAQTTNVSLLPAGVGLCPFPGWHPGTTTGGTLTQAQAKAWYTWYLGALNNAHMWEINAHRAGGWAGVASLTIPGRGCTPTVYNNNFPSSGTCLTLPGGDNSLCYGAPWHLVIQDMIGLGATADSTVLDISSMFAFDANGGVNDQPSSIAADNALSLAAADPSTTGWSSARWLSYLARTQPTPLYIVGESVGEDHLTGSHQWGLASQVSGAMAQAKACGLYGYFWANDLCMNDPGTPNTPPYATPANVVSGFNTAYGTSYS